MQVMKSSMGYSSPRPETQSVDRSTGTNAHIFPHLGLSYRVLDPGKKPLSCRAVVYQEKVKPVLSVVKESGFKITKNRPEPIPAQLVKYETIVSEISRCYKCGKFEEALRKASMLLEVIPRTPENNDFIQYVNTIIFLCHIMKDMTSCLHLPSNDSEEFINWQLSIADLASKETTDLPASSRLMLYNLRWAADAGNLEAKHWLAKAMLFAGLCRGIPSRNLHFFPAEAVGYLEDMARSGALLPVPTNDQDLVINRMVEVIRLRNADDREREDLVDFLRKQSNPEMQLLIPLIYTGEAFGILRYDKAEDFLSQFNRSFQEKNLSPYIKNLYMYWYIVCTIDVSEFEIAIEEFYKLACDDFLVAIYQLSELFVEHGSRSIKNIEYIKRFIEFPDPVVLEYPYLTYSLHYCYAKIIKLSEGSIQTSDKQKPSPSRSGSASKMSVKQKRHRAKAKSATETVGNKDDSHKRMEDNARVFLISGLIQGNPSTRELSLYSHLSSVFIKENLQKIGSVSSSNEDIQIVTEILNNSRYTQNPIVFVYLHCVQVILGIEDEQNLIETVEQKDAISTYFHMLSMSDATTTMDNVVLVDKLLDLPHIDVQDFLRWKRFLAFRSFLQQLRMYAPLCQKPERCLLLCLKLSYAIGASEQEIMETLVALAREKTLQDDPEQANGYYAKACVLSNKMLKQEKDPYEVQEDYQVRRSGLPEYYQQLLSIHTDSSHPLETRCRFDRLMSVWEQMQESKDPSLFDEWVQKVSCFIINSHWHLSPDMCQKLRDCCSLAIKKQKTLSLELVNNANKRLLELLNVCGTTKEKLCPPASGVCLPEVEQVSADGSLPLPQALSGIDEIARLPVLEYKGFGYMEDHHIVPRIQAARSIEEVIGHIKKLSIEHQFDPTVLIKLAAPWFESAPAESASDIFVILDLLHVKLRRYVALVTEVPDYSMCSLIWSVNYYCKSFTGNVDQSMNELIETTEKDKTAAFIQKNEMILESREGLSNEEPELFFWAGKSEMSPEKFDFNYFIANIDLYHPRILLKIFSKIGDREREQCISKLQDIREKNGSSSHFTEFFIYQIAGQKEKLWFFLDGILKKRTIDDKGKAILLWYAYESSLITDDILRKKIVNLDKRSPWYCFLTFLIEEAKHAAPLNKHKLLSQIKSLDGHCQDAAGFNRFSLGRFDDAADLWEKCRSAYPLAMLAWHHGIQPEKQTVDVEEQLLIAAKKGQVKAQCELIHWLLKRENDGGKVDSLLKYKASRFVQMPSPMAGAESVLYQGITQYLGFGCDPDLMTGRKKIQEALAKDPLVVALRLYDLKEQGVFILPNDSTDYLWCYAQALSKRDKDPFNRRDNYFNNLLLNYGSEALQKLLTSLHGKAESDPSNKLVYQQAASRLEEWLGQWQGGSASSANAPRKTSKVTVSPTKESQKALKESACTEDDVDQVIDCATADNWNSGALGKINQLTNRLRLEKTDLKTETKGEIEEKLHILLTVMPVGTQELAKCADAVVDLISSPEKVTELILFWITQSKFAQNRDEKAFWLERILKCFPKDHSINLNDHKEEVLCFLELLIQHQLIPKEAEYLLDGLSADERAQLLLKGLPEGINANPKMYQQYVETVQSPDSTLIDNIWCALKSESDAALVRATFTALIRQRSSELCAIKADDGRLNGIDLYRLFSDSSTSDRETLLEDTFFALRELLVKSYLQFRKENPGKLPPPKHLESTVRKFVDGKQRSIKDSLDILIMTREHKVDDAALLQDYHRKIKEKALECMDRVEAGREQQNLRLTAWAILSLTL